MLLVVLHFKLHHFHALITCSKWARGNGCFRANRSVTSIQEHGSSEVEAKPAQTAIAKTRLDVRETIDESGRRSPVRRGQEMRCFVDR